MFGLFLVALLSGSAIKVADAAPPVLPPLTGKDVLPLPTTRRPSSGTTYYPPKAMNAGKEGIADITCVISEDHVITQCAVLKEAPQKWGFGAATVELFTGAKVPDTTKSGEPTAGRQYIIHMNFKLAG